ncbi:ATP-binding protein [Psychrobacillus sp.]|uniref:ATP-binding response regulator n=1 Tax=Psychrobacillus sp. TaxID=1871623 RepID=UPI0028BE75C6|nr:ATP-binding protein [Psychrobacillus sp.]
MEYNRNTIYIWKVLVIAILFVLVLTVLRLFWIAAFEDADQPQIVDGELDLRNWDFSDDPSITLDGEWEFQPYTWLIDNKDTDAKDPQYITVPGNWGTLLNPEDHSTYGYGSYRLRILVDSASNSIYGIRISSVRSASELYANGQLLEKSGTIGESEENSVGWNVPYTSSLFMNDDGVIEVVIQASNFQAPDRGGLIRSVKFGTKDAIAREVKLSETLQLITSVIFIVHALFACMLFLGGFRDKRLLYFAVVTVGTMLYYLLASDEKILLDWLPLGYNWAFKLTCLSMLASAYALIQCVKPQFPALLRKYVHYHAILCGGVALLTIILPLHYLSEISSLCFVIVIVSALLAAFALLRVSFATDHGNYLLIMSIISMGNHFVWAGIFTVTGIKVMYYPIDLILSVAFLAAVWFRHYHQLHVETKKQAKKLQQADKFKDEFLANTSHELRNPLHGILNMSQAVLERERGTLEAKSLSDMEVVLSVGRRMSLLLDDLLDATSLKEGGPKLQLKPFFIQTVISGVVDMLQFMMEGKSIRVINGIPDSFPPLFADENRVIQIVFNLLHNAVKYTNEGEITIEGYVKGKNAHIVILDTGIGMDEETMQNVFTPYEQGHHSESVIKGGLGLGLGIAKQLVELHEGTLQAHSTLGTGSEFTFTLPISDAPIANDVSASDDSVKLVVAETLSQLEAQQELVDDLPRILVVDDDPINLQVINSILSSDHYEILTVTSGEKALVALHAKEWDLVISDVMMPQMSGYELTQKIRKIFSMTELPVLLLTARSQSTDIEKGFLSGANDYVTKPVDALELRSRVRTLTSVKRSMHERLRMEAAWLQAQIQPHFLFNTLNTVIALSEIDLKRMNNVLEALSRLLWKKFQFDNMNELTHIEEEITLIQAYLLIEKERFGDRLRVVWEIDEGLDLMIPSLTIQPLVENAIGHGIMKRITGGQLTIRISNYDTYVEISVEDDGIGIDETVLTGLLERTPSNQSGIGLLNTDLRLKRLFGKGLQIISAPNEGTKVNFIVYKDFEDVREE